MERGGLNELAHTSLRLGFVTDRSRIFFFGENQGPGGGVSNGPKGSITMRLHDQSQNDDRSMDGNAEFSVFSLCSNSSPETLLNARGRGGCCERGNGKEQN